MKRSPKKDDIQELNYEQAISELETIVSSLENDQKPLDEAIALYERGQALANHCASLLDRAELRIQQVSAQTPKNPEDGAVD